MKQKSLSAEPPILGFLVPLRLVLPLPGYQVFARRRRVGPAQHLDCTTEVSDLRAELDRFSA
jgi:hypothetical protein